MTDSSLAPPSGRLAEAWAAIRTVLPSFVTARILVGVALVVAHLVIDNGGVDDPLARVTTNQGLLAWDGAFYADIAQHGYAALPRAALRFFPLTAIFGRGLGWIGVGPRVGVVLVANIAALLAGVLLLRLVLREGFGPAVATRTTWLLALAPSAFVLVLGYSEALFLAVAIGILLCARDRRWLWCVPLGILAGLNRPSGFIVAVPIAVEAWRAIAATPWRERCSRAIAVIAPFVGTALYLLWVEHRFGDGLFPFRVQTRAEFKGSFTNPVDSISHAVDGFVSGSRIGTGLHLPWMVLVIVLIVVVFRRLPASYGWYSIAAVASAVTSDNLDSFERYALGAFPILIAAALVLERLHAKDVRLERAVIALSGLTMTGYATLAFLHVYVP